MSAPVRVLLLSGRYLAENPYRELGIMKALQEKGCDVTFALPARSLNKNGYTGDMRHDSVFGEVNALWLKDEEDFAEAVKGNDIFLCGSWKSYHMLVDIARKEGAFTANYMSTGGTDHWPNGVDHINVRSPFDKRKMMSSIEKLPEHLQRGNPTITITGGVMYNGVDTTPSLTERKAICAHYGVDPEQPITVLFPKGIESFRAKVPIWFKDWSKKACERYCEEVENIYRRICQHSVDVFGHVFIKMHPSSYTSYMCDRDEERAFWTTVPHSSVVEPEHGLGILRNMDVGLGVTTHAAMDTNYFERPFIYVDSLDVEMPDLDAFHIHTFSQLKGPSTQWGCSDTKQLGYYLPAWVGEYSRSNDLVEKLKTIGDGTLTTRQDYTEFNEEFWGADIETPSTAIAKSTLTAFQNINKKRKSYTAKLMTAFENRLSSLLPLSRQSN